VVRGGGAVVQRTAAAVSHRRAPAATGHAPLHHGRAAAVPRATGHGRSLGMATGPPHRGRSAATSRRRHPPAAAGRSPPAARQW